MRRKARSIGTARLAVTRPPDAALSCVAARRLADTLVCTQGDPLAHNAAFIEDLEALVKAGAPPPGGGLLPMGVWSGGERIVHCDASGASVCSQHRCSSNDFSVIESQVEVFAAERVDLSYGVDGMVVRVDAFAQQEVLGATSKAPRWCVAFKYPAEQGRTILERVDWQVGRNGTLTPRATMQPIRLAGTQVQHATLHNIEEIHRRQGRSCA